MLENRIISQSDLMIGIQKGIQQAEDIADGKLGIEGSNALFSCSFTVREDNGFVCIVIQKTVSLGSDDIQGSAFCLQ